MFTVPVRIVYNKNGKTSVYSHNRLVAEGNGPVFEAFGKNVEKKAVGEVVEVKQGNKVIKTFEA